MKDQNSFKSLNILLQKIAKSYHRALTAFRLYQALDNIEVATIVGENEAKQNVEIEKKFPIFFITMKISLQSFFMINLANFFDKDNDVLCVQKIINKAQCENKELTAENFKQCHVDREHIDELVRFFQTLNQKDFSDISKLFESRPNDVESVKTYRDQWFAHEQLKKKDRPDLSDEGIEALFLIISKILNILVQKLNVTTFEWAHIQESAKNEVETIFKNLRDYEPIRISTLYTKADEESKTIDQ